jgi:hypothetical protein
MENFQKYLSTAPVLLTLLMSFTAGFIIEINRFNGSTSFSWKSDITDTKPPVKEESWDHASAKKEFFFHSKP